MPSPITRLVVLQHAALEGPVRIGTAAERMGLKVEIVRLDQGQTVPAKPPSGALLVSMGGPMGVSDLSNPAYPFLMPEVELLRACLHDNHPVIGICLGAQLLAHAAGATVAPLHCGDPPQRHYEVGWGAIHLLRDPGDENVLAGLERSELVLHWHGDAFTIPPGADHLAATLACPGQMFRIGNSYGLQFHIEVDEPTVKSWVESDADFIRAANGANGAQRILADTARFMPIHRQRGDRLIGNILRVAMQGGCPN
ncbi:MAG: gamma-glutamyl-gamma-aminobutyrate hydrolase family protein [Planctomycetota bacterium]